MTHKDGKPKTIACLDWEVTCPDGEVYIASASIKHMTEFMSPGYGLRLLKNARNAYRLQRTW